MSDPVTGPFTSAVKNLLSTAIGIVQTRLELLSTEWEEERARLARILIAVSLALFFTCIATVLVATLVLVAFWESYRFWALGAVAGAFVVAAFACWRIAAAAVAAKPRLFASTLAALAEDRDALRGEHS
jgi:uncharacterized membrane protein YqjE